MGNAPSKSKTRTTRRIVDRGFPFWVIGFNELVRLIPSIPESPPGESDHNAYAEDDANAG